MKVISPTNFIDAYMGSTNVGELVPVWAYSTNYAIGDVVYYDGTNIHRKYKRLTAGITGTAPNLDLVNWVDIGPNNKWAMFDTSNSTVTVATDATPPGSMGPAYSIWQSQLYAGGDRSLALFGLVATQVRVMVVSLTTFLTTYDQTFTVAGTDAIPASLVISNIPIPANSSFAYAIGNGGAVAKCSTAITGTEIDLGVTQYNTTLGIVSYSKKDTDAFGITTFTKRANSKRMSVKTVIDNVNLNTIYQNLAYLEATPCAWLASNVTDLAPLNVFGFFRDFSIDVAYPTQSLCSIEIEGLA